MQDSPYSPGDVAPRFLAGRNAEEAAGKAALQRMAGMGVLVPRITVYTGPRGMGKTSLLRRLERDATDEGAVTVWVTAGADGNLLAAVASELERKTKRWGRAARALASHITELKLTLKAPGVELQATAVPGSETPPSARALQALLTEAWRVAVEQGDAGILLLVDEIQEAEPADLRTLAYCWQHMQGEARDVATAVFAAGLPGSPTYIAKIVTSAERFDYRPLGPLLSEDGKLALARPAKDLGVIWEADALTLAAEHARGYPHTVQLLGEATWAAAGYPDPGSALTSMHVAQAVPEVVRQLDGLFRARWERCTAGEQAFLAAMASLGDGPYRRGQVAEQLGRPVGSESSERQRLLDKGLIASTGRGQVDFTIPGFADYVRGIPLGG